VHATHRGGEKRGRVVAGLLAVKGMAPSEKRFGRVPEFGESLLMQLSVVAVSLKKKGRLEGSVVGCAVRPDVFLREAELFGCRNVFHREEEILLARLQICYGDKLLYGRSKLVVKTVRWSKLAILFLDSWCLSRIKKGSTVSRKL
jgi:hypothetical protein